VALGGVHPVAPVFFLALDLGVFHRGAQRVKFKEAAMVHLLVVLALLFASPSCRLRGRMKPSSSSPATSSTVLSMETFCHARSFFTFFRVPRSFSTGFGSGGILGAPHHARVMISPAPH